MKIRLDRHRDGTLVEQARDQIISALHTGMLHRGDRLPSLRQVAALSGLNIKTVMGVYATLQREGLLVLRPGSGAFVAGQEMREFEPAHAAGLRRVLQRHLDEVSGMNIPPDAYATLVQRLVTRASLAARSVGVLECNAEQVQLFAAEIRSRLGVAAHPILLDDAHAREMEARVTPCSILAITDFHAAQGADIARRFHRPLVRLRLRRDFVPALMDAARRGRLAMIVSDPSFDPAFRRTLGHLGLSGEQLERISVVAGSDRGAVQRALARADVVYVSPLCDRRIRELVPPDRRKLEFARHLADDSLEELESWLLLSGPPDPATPSAAR
jgi:DNA-binding transcriptional regulator YhcF (GntR family)